MPIKHFVPIAAGALVLASVTLAITGSVVIFDPDREVASAQLVDGWGHKQPLLSVIVLRVGLPRLEGTVRLTCKNGRLIEDGYVTPRGRTWQKVSKADCRRP